MERLEADEGKAVPFIQIDEASGRFEVSIEAMSVLEGVGLGGQKKKVAVVAIAGPYRTGKSFLANRFIGRMKAFTIGSTVQSCTRGIWMWNKLIPISDEVDALLLDTEGLGSTDREFSTDIKIFALSILLSSTFLFNQIGHITEQSLEDLSAVLRLTEELRIRDAGAGT